MPFGKYCGGEVNELPESYLMWLWRNATLFGVLLYEIARILERDPSEHERICRERRERESQREHRAYSSSASGFDIGPEKELFAEVINVGYRTLAIRLHPDHGGDGETMRRLNRAIGGWRKQLTDGTNE
jgi:hypothetical protein